MTASARSAVPRGIVLLLCIAALALAPRADAQRDSPLYPLLDVELVGRELLAIDAETGGELSIRLERGEQVVKLVSQGRVGVVLTDRRLLAAATRSGTWQEARYRRDEAPPTRVELGDRVALALLKTRVVGFDGGSRNLIEATLGPRETVLDTAVGANVAVVVTDRRSLGLSAERGGFFDVRMRLEEDLESVRALASLVKVRTSQRLLIFRASTASWEERRLPIR